MAAASVFLQGAARYLSMVSLAFSALEREGRRDPGMALDLSFSFLFKILIKMGRISLVLLH